jgi:outer membrane usher protein
MAATAAQGFEILPDADTDVATLEQSGYDYYLDVSINGVSCDKIVAIHQEPDGSLSVLPDDLKSIGLLPPGPDAGLGDARIALGRLPDVTYVFDAETQSINFIAPDTARIRLIVDARDDGDGSPGARINDAGGNDGEVSNGLGVLLNYDVYANASKPDAGGIVVAPLAGTFEARAYGPFGLVAQTFSVLSDPFVARRLDTIWSYSDPASMRTFRAGDVTTGALGWTRPTRLGGIQVQNDFGLRSDVITYPVPSLSGSAALPSSVDLLINNTDRYSGTVPAGPFDIVNIPVITGAGTVQLVVKDPTGKQVVTTLDYFTSPQLLKPGLIDYSAELGFARTRFGGSGDGYDPRLMASASIRTGVTDWLTWEGHAEGGLALLSGGSGYTAALGRRGVGQFSVAASRTAQAVGLQVGGSAQFAFGAVRIGARALRSFGRYEDIASFTAPGIVDHSSPTPAAVYQLSLSLPTPWEGGRANLSYTQSERPSGEMAQIVSASYGQRLFSGSGSATAYYDIKSRNYGVALSMWSPIGALSGGTSVRRDAGRTLLTANLGRNGGGDVGDTSWLLEVAKDDSTDFSASTSTELPAATLRARAARSGSQTGVQAELSGSVVAADGGVFLARPVSDAFAVVDVGAAGIPVMYENRLVGVTGNNGKLLVPGLSAYQKNRVSIDPTKLPLDKVVEDTTALVSPARGAGVVVTFGKQTSGGTALVSFRDAAGEYLPLASTGKTGPDAEEFIVGYDGAALVDGLVADNKVTITLPDGGSCEADFPYAASGGELANISDVVCRPL